jgi:hypothetical protein
METSGWQSQGYCASVEEDIAFDDSYWAAVLQPCVKDSHTLMNMTFLLKMKLYELRHFFRSASIGCTLSGYATVLYMAHGKRYWTFVDTDKKKGQMNGRA